MKYEGTVYRPPSEAYSLIIQVTIGCAHNKCSFCSMYKDKDFRIRSIEEICEDLKDARKAYKYVERIFLADGDALVISMDKLKVILEKVKELFPECKRVGVYATPKDVLNKSLEELKLLKSMGIGIAYIGLESGSDKVLVDINKGTSAEEFIIAGKRIKESGIKLSVTLIAGIAGRNGLKEHAIESAKVVSKINPDYLGILTLMVEKNTELYEKIKASQFELLNTEEILIETKTFIEAVEVRDCIFRSNHASNYINLAGTLPYDKERLLNDIEEALSGNIGLKEEFFRSL